MPFFEIQYPSDWTPLHIGVWRHDFEQTRLLANPWTVNGKDDKGWTPVHLACTALGCMVFYSHQILGRQLDRDNLRRGIVYSDLDTNERATSLGMLEILLEHKPDLNIRALGFCTPLHCAANSGWLNHAKVLVEAGAPVYTGPTCSPLCWVEGGSGGNNDVALYLRQMLGDRGLAMIEDDHAQMESEINQREPSSESQLRELREPALDTRFTCRGVLPRPKSQDLSIKSDGLCRTCAGMSFKELVSPRGYVHLPSLDMIHQSAKRCRFCKIVFTVLSKHRSPNPRARSQIIVRISNGDKTHQGMCTDPPLLRSLEFILSPGCSCSAYNGSMDILSHDYSDCRGSCDRIAADLVTIFTQKETKLNIEHELDRRTGSTYEAPWSIQQGIEIDADPLSSSCIKLIQCWLDRCERGHKSCTRDGLTKSLSHKNSLDISLPTRVIDVKSADGISIRLCEGSGKFGKYLALSHRWVSGPMPAWVTKEISIESRHDWFPPAQLPSSITDAVRVTRELGLQYLWVDSLCIIQDSSNDWDAKSSRMVNVYANAHFTIFADCGRDHDHGFLHPRTPTSSTSVVIPTKRDLRLELNLRKSLDNDYKSVQKMLFPTNVQSSHLANRGWILQERILSRRILHFGKDQMFWECAEGTFAEDGHTVTRRGIRECGRPEDPFSKLTYSSVLNAGGPVPPETFASQWEALVRVYSILKLTRQEDKLHAISGLAAAFQIHAKNNEYVAGLWEESLVQQLAWSITNKKPEHVHRVWQTRIYEDDSVGGMMEKDETFVHESQLFPRPTISRAPTFSWAAVDGEIEFHPLGNQCAYSKSVTFEREYPYGRQKDWCLTISGPLRRGMSCGPLPDDLSGFLPRRKGYTPLYDQEGVPFGYMYTDSTDDVHHKDIYALKLGEKTYPNDVFLVLVPVHDSDMSSPKFRRIGLGQPRDECGFFFADAEAQTIRLV